MLQIITNFINVQNIYMVVHAAESPKDKKVKNFLNKLKSDNSKDIVHKMGGDAEGFIIFLTVIIIAGAGVSIYLCISRIKYFKKYFKK